MTQPQQPVLVSPDDPDWASFQAQDADWFLKAASDELRRWCGWHLNPVVTSTYTQLRVGERGIVMLPSRYVTDVSEVKVQRGVGETPELVDPNSYTWYPAGWIEPINANQWANSGYYYGYGPAYTPVYQAGTVDVTFTHGWDVLPNDIKEVVMELAAQGAQHAAASNVDEVASPGFKLRLREGGMAMSPSQKSRLASYKIGATR